MNDTARKRSNRARARRPRPGRILLAKADPERLNNSRHFFNSHHYQTTTASTAAETVAKLHGQVFELCILDAALAANGLPAFIHELKEIAPWTAILVVTDSDSTEQALAALDAGAADYLRRPCSPLQLHIAAYKHLEIQRAEHRLDCLIQEVGPLSAAESGLASHSPLMRKVLETAEHVAATDATVLVVGESGTGKGVLARAIHQCSSRDEGNFVTVNCPSLSAELLESELFGHRKGAFTGAVANHPGRISQAEGGTLFLDEIGDVPLPLQPKLLRFVQDREFERIGDPTTRKADVRLIAATNQDLAWMVETQRFRQDLYYRLNVVSLEIPPLRARHEDILPLARHFLERFAREYGKPAREISPAACAALQAYRWPGNVRELRNLMERQIILGHGAELKATDLQLGISQQGEPQNMGGSLAGNPVSLKEVEMAHIRAVIAASESMDAAAATLGIHPSTLWRKRKAYGL